MWELKKKNFELQTPLMEAEKLGGRAGVAEDHELVLVMLNIKHQQDMQTEWSK